MMKQPVRKRINTFLILRTTRDERRALSLLGLVIALSLLGLTLFRF